MFDEIEFDKIKRLPKYVFAAINEIKLEMRRNNEDVIDFSMGNPDGATPEHIIQKLWYGRTHKRVKIKDIL